MFAGAAFTDEADINADNRDAVELLTALNIIQGYEDGSFDPSGTVTRAEMAKMIYTIRNGGNDDASAYESVTTSFTDISGHWAEGYIKYLQNTGIVAGKSATRFDPNSQVTTGEAMKMALALAGYDEVNAGLTGVNWLNNTVSYATTYGLTEDVHSAIAGGCTRQDAAQILSNCLIDVIAVRYSSIVEGFVNDSEKGLAFTGEPMTVGEKWMDLRVETGFITAAPNSKTNPKGITFYYDNNDDDGTPDTPVTFKNATQDVSDLFGYEVKVVWNSDKKDDSDAIYGIYKTSNNTEYTMTWDDVEQDAKNANKIKFDGSTYELDLNDTVADAVDGYVDLKQYSNHSANVADDKTVIAAYVDGDKLGVDASVFKKAALADTVTFIDNDGDGKIEAVQIKETDVAKISYVSNSGLTSTLVGPARSYAPTYTNSPKLTDVNTYEGMAKDDYAKVTYDYHNDKLTYEKLDLQTGTIEATRTDATGTKEIRIDGNWYEASDDYTTMPTGLYTNDTVEFVAIDNLLYHVKKTDGAYGSKSLALIYNAANYNVGVDAGKVEVALITRDGETMKVIVDSDYGWNGGAIPANLADMNNKVVTYRVVDGEYRFAEIGADNRAGFDQAGTATAVYTGDSDKFAGKDISSDAVVFVYDADTATNTPKVMSGKTFMDNAGTSDAFYANYLYNDNNGFDEVMVMAVGYNTIPTVVGSTYGVLTADAYETELDEDGYRYFNMYISGLGDVVAREKNGDTYTYTAGTVMKYELVSTDEDGTVTIKNVDSVTPTTGMVTSDGIFETKYIGLDGGKYEVDADTVYIDMDTQDNEGVAYGDEVKAKLTKADVANNTANVRYVVAGPKVKFILIDSERNEIVLGTTIESPSASTLTQILADAQSGETITIEGTVPAGTFTSKSDVTLELADGAVITGATTITTSGTGAVKVTGVVDVNAGSLSMPAATTFAANAGFDVTGGIDLILDGTNYTDVVGDGDWKVTFNEDNGFDLTIKSDSTTGGILPIYKADSLTIPEGVTVTAGANVEVNGTATIEGVLDMGTYALNLGPAGRVTVASTGDIAGTGAITANQNNGTDPGSVVVLQNTVTNTGINGTLNAVGTWSYATGTWVKA